MHTDCEDLPDGGESDDGNPALPGQLEAESVGEEGEEGGSGRGAASETVAAFRTTISKRCMRFVDSCFAKGDLFLKRYTKRKWAEQSAAHARLQARLAAEAGVGDDGGSGGKTAAAGGTALGEAGSAAISETPAAPSAAAPSEAMPDRAAQRKRKQKPLVEAECFMAFVLPNGRIEHSSSDGVKACDLARKQRDNFVASLELMVREQQIRASVDRRVELRAEQRRAQQTSAAEGVQLGRKEKHVPLSKRLRTAVREAFQRHVAPVLGDLKVCAPVDWRQCIVEEGSTECAAGGQCKEARAALDWPNNLACVDPNRNDCDNEWKVSVLGLLKVRGHGVEIPTAPAPKRCLLSPNLYRQPTSLKLAY